jgi:hydroxymethylpyrimidine/phosphomethylpyrimidine kinase
LLPLATVATPNIPEAELLLGRAIRDGADAEAALRELHGLGAAAVLLKGGHLDEGAEVVDRFVDRDGVVAFRHPRIAVEGHGTGCTLAAAIAANLCLGRSPRDAVEAATGFVAEALRLGRRPGLGPVVVLDAFGAAGRR